MNIRIRRRGPKWQLDYRDPKTGRRVRRTIPARNKREAQQIADHTHQQLLNQSYPSHESHTSYPITDALEEAIANTTANEHTQANYRHQARQIASWFAEHYPSLDWPQLTLEILRSYTDHCTQTCAPATTRLRVHLLRSAGRHLAVTRSIPDPTAAWRVRLRPDPTKERETMERKILTPKQVAYMLCRFQNWHNQLSAVCGLQALAGLRVTEALGLSEGDVDLIRGTVTIRDTQWHRTKNPESHRVLPICDKVQDLIKAAFPEFRMVITFRATYRDGIDYAPLFRTKSNEPWTVSGWSHVMRSMFDTLDEYSADDTFRGYQPRWLRASFATAVRSRGVDERLVKAYLGHSSGDTLGRHYEHLSVDALQPVATAIADWLTEKEVKEATR